jgi:hypothetical protein
MVRSKKVCFSESSLPTGDRSRRSYYLNGMVCGRWPWVEETHLGDLTTSSFSSGIEWGAELGWAAPWLSVLTV